MLPERPVVQTSKEPTLLLNSREAVDEFLDKIRVELYRAVDTMTSTASAFSQLTSSELQVLGDAELAERKGVPDASSKTIIATQLQMISQLQAQVQRLLDEKQESSTPSNNSLATWGPNGTVNLPQSTLDEFESSLHNSNLPLQLHPFVLVQPTGEGTNEATKLANTNSLPAVLQPSTMQQVIILRQSQLKPVLTGQLASGQVPTVLQAMPLNHGEAAANSSQADNIQAEMELNLIPSMQPPQEPQQHSLQLGDISVADEPTQLEELERFAMEFKTRRTKLGFTQGDVGLSLGKMYGSDFSQTTISRFEALNLSFKNMCKLKPVLDRWIEDAERHIQKLKSGQQHQLMPCVETKPRSFITLRPDDYASGKRRKKRASIESTAKIALEKSFQINPKPSTAEMNVMAENLFMERETVRIWFCNRRQKAKRLPGDLETTEMEEDPLTSDTGQEEPQRGDVKCSMTSED